MYKFSIKLICIVCIYIYIYIFIYKTIKTNQEKSLDLQSKTTKFTTDFIHRHDVLIPDQNQSLTPWTRG